MIYIDTAMFRTAKSAGYLGNAALGTSEMKTEIIIMTIGAEGGSIDLVGARTDGNWQFRIETSDQRWMLEDDDDHGPPVSPWVSTWPDAVAQLDLYPWPQLHPVRIHPEFRAMVAQGLKQKEKMGVPVNWAIWAAALGPGF